MARRVVRRRQSSVPGRHRCLEVSSLHETILRQSFSVVGAGNEVVRSLDFAGSPRESTDNRERQRICERPLESHAGDSDAGSRSALRMGPDYWHDCASTQTGRGTGAEGAGRAEALGRSWGVYYDSADATGAAGSRRRAEQPDHLVRAGRDPIELADDLHVCGGRAGSAGTPRYNVASVSAERALPWKLLRATRSDGEERQPRI